MKDDSYGDRTVPIIYSHARLWFKDGSYGDRAVPIIYSHARLWLRDGSYRTELYKSLIAMPGSG